MSAHTLGGAPAVVNSATEVLHARTRDPQRKNRILASASELIGRKGFHAVSIADIGNAAGITGSGVYRHFDSKSAILVALFDQVIDNLIADEQRILDDTAELLRDALNGQAERRAWILEHWPHVVELQEIDRCMLEVAVVSREVPEIVQLDEGAEFEFEL